VVCFKVFPPHLWRDWLKPRGIQWDGLDCKRFTSRMACSG